MRIAPGPMTDENTLHQENLGCPWPNSFFEDRNFPEEKSFLEARNQINPTDDDILNFLLDYDENTAEEEIITKFCSGVHHSALTNPRAQHSRRAWLDDRRWDRPTKPSSREEEAEKQMTPPVNMAKESESKDLVDEARTSLQDRLKYKIDSPFREYEPPLSALDLFRYLKRKRFGHGSLPDADRRLIYVWRLTPVYVHALVRTCTQHQSAALKATLYMHIARKTDMGVNISYNSIDTFELYFYMPFYTLKVPDDPDILHDGLNGSSHPACLDIFSITGKSSQVLEMAHIAINICGVADRRWTGYAFVDDDECMSEEDFDYTTIVPDQFALNGEVDANRPIWSPREYFMRILPSRVEQIVRRWSWIIQNIESGAQEDILSPTAGYGENEEIASTFKRTQKAAKTLGILHDVLSESNDAWAEFSAPGGDIIYFEHTTGLSATSQKQIKRCLQDLKGKFRRMRALQRRLETLERRYQRAVDSLERLLVVESNKAAKSSGAHAELMVAWISPVAIVSAFFSIPAPFVPRTLIAFTVAMLVVAGFLQLVIRLQRKGWRWQIQRFCSHVLHQRESRPVVSGTTEQIHDQQTSPFRVDTGQTLVDSGV
ncbi:hypothetical protein DPSP01_008735 [Paraphaeosphaeria sporulosa]